VNAVILAGGGKTDEFAHRHGAQNKALIPIAGKTMFEHVFAALQNSKYVQQVVIVGPVKEFGKYAGRDVQVVEDTGDMVSNCLAAIRLLPVEQPVALVTSDIPMLTAGVLDNYLAKLEAKEADFYYPIIAKEINEQRYPGVKRTYASLREGTFTGGNIIVINPKVAERIAAKVREFVAQRKNVIMMCSIVGLGFLLKLVTKRLTISEAERKISDLLGCRCLAVECHSPEIGTDVDKDSDLELARKVLESA